VHSLRHVLSLLLLCFVFVIPNLHAQQQPAAATNNSVSAAHQQQGPSYQLSGDKLQKAIRVSRIRSTVHFVEAGWGILAMLILLSLRVPARLRDWAVNATPRFGLQCLIVLAPFLILTTLLSLPIDAYMQHVNLSYGLSIQGWASWLWGTRRRRFLYLLRRDATCLSCCSSLSYAGVRAAGGYGSGLDLYRSQSSPYSSLPSLSIRSLMSSNLFSNPTLHSSLSWRRWSVTEVSRYPHRECSL